MTAGKFTVLRPNLSLAWLSVVRIRTRLSRNGRPIAVQTAISDLQCEV